MVSLEENAHSGYKHLLELHNFYKLNVSYVTTCIIISDYFPVTDKFKFKKYNSFYGLGTNKID